MAELIYPSGSLQPANSGDVYRLAQYMQLPPIRGRWWFVEPGHGADTAEGDDWLHPLATLEEAYDRCITGAGDGIAFCPVADATGSHSLSMTHTLTW
ncbi:MAG: hypothetical protein WCY09_10480, partial [Candidatus Omnitrophota bacterium]